MTLSPSTLGAEVQGLPVNSQRRVTVSSDTISGEIFPVNSNVSYPFSDDTPVSPTYELCLDVAVDGIENLSNIKIKTSDENGNFDVPYTSHSVNVTEAVSSVRIGVAGSNGLLKVEYDEGGVTHSEVYSLSNLTRRKGFVFKNPKSIYNTLSGTNPLDAEVGDSGVVNENTVMHSKATVNTNGTISYEMSVEGKTGLALDLGGQSTVDKTLFLELTDEFNELNPGMNGYTFVVGNPPPVASGGITGNVIKIPKTAWNGSTVNMTLSNSIAMTSVSVVINAEGETLADDIVTPGEGYVSTDITIPTGFTGTVYKFPGETIRDFNNESVEVDSVYRVKVLSGEIGADNKITLPIDSSLVEIQSGESGYFDTSLWIMDYDGNYYTTAGRVDVTDTGFPAITFTVPDGVFNVSDPSRAGIVTFSGHVEQVQTAENVGTTLSKWLFEGSGYFTKPSPTPVVVPDSLVTTPDMTAQTCAYPANQTVTVTQSSIALQDNVDGYGEAFTGTISGQVYGYVDPNEETQYRLGFKLNEALIKSTSQIGFKLYDANNNEINLGSMSFAGSEMPADGYIAISVGSTNIGPADPEDIKKIVAEYVDWTNEEDVKFITVTYTTNLTKGS